ncbi:MAG: hypothetical protein K8I82_28485 [Anaerolineae bacterium]|nr:hypothetical protein [Anaerolineae bacterium]
MKALVIFFTLLALLLVSVGTAYAQDPEPDHHWGHPAAGNPTAESFRAWIENFMLRLYRFRDCYFFADRMYEQQILHLLTEMIGDCSKMNNVIQK